MNKMIEDEILAEGMEALFQRLGPIRAVRFLQLIGATTGDATKELRERTEGMTRDEVLRLVRETRREKGGLWKRIGLV